MSFPASTQLLSDVLAGARAVANAVRQESMSLRDRSAVSSVSRIELVNYMGKLSKALAVWDTARSTSGIGPYAQSQLGSPTLDVNAEFTAMLNATTTLRDWVFNNFPKDASSGAWLVYSYDNSGAATELVFTTIQLAQFRTNVDALLATIA